MVGYRSRPLMGLRLVFLAYTLAGCQPQDGGSAGRDASAETVDVAAKLCQQPPCVCSDNTDCPSGLCVATADGPRCAEKCLGTKDCPQAWECVPSAPYGTVCLPLTASWCAPCQSDADCSSPWTVGAALCLSLGPQGNFCTRRCSSEAQCPAGYACSGAPAYCVPSDEKCLCSLWAVQEGHQTSCVRKNQVGTCSSKLTCTQLGPWPTCPANDAQPESCNGQDDDCDGVTDDNAAASCNDADPCTMDACDLAACVHKASNECADGTCASACGETALTCIADCHVCGNEVCEPGEGPTLCPEDCCGGCGDKKCKGYGCGESPASCPGDCAAPCGDGICDKGQNPGNCPEDCLKFVCGNGRCEPTDLGPVQCPEDCAPGCGDCVCSGGEDYDSCPVDCGWCGDGVCSPCSTLNEYAKCAKDCDAATSQACDATATSFCDDGAPCTADACQLGLGCIHQPIVSPCSDGDACTVGDACQQGACVPASALLCDDANPCTTDACNPAAGCTATDLPDGATCSDGDACNLPFACTDAQCTAVPPPDCDDANPCTVDGCDPLAGCTHAAAAPGTVCVPSSDACHLPAVCTVDVCPDPPLVDCNDGDSCTTDACAADTGCTHTGLGEQPDESSTSQPLTLTERNDCDGNDPLWRSGLLIGTDDVDAFQYQAVDSLGCVDFQPMARLVVQDGSATLCAIFYSGQTAAIGPGISSGCVEATPGKPAVVSYKSASLFPDPGMYALTVIANPKSVACQAYQLSWDGESYGVCEPCIAPPCQKSCDAAGWCTLGPQTGGTCSSDGNPCTADTCSAGLCTHPALADGTTCNDFTTCTQADVCNSGTCAGIPVANDVTCTSDGKVCTADLCQQGQCAHPPLLVPTACNDGLPCTEGDACQPTGACKGNPVTDGTPCGASGACSAGQCQ